MSSDLRESTAAAIYNADPRHVRRFEDGGIAYEVRQKYLLQADAALATLLEHGQPIKAYRCPRCGEFSDRDIHCYVKGPPLFPQMDDYTICERVEGVFVESSPCTALIGAGAAPAMRQRRKWLTLRLAAR